MDLVISSGGPAASKDPSPDLTVQMEAKAAAFVELSADLSNELAAVIAQFLESIALPGFTSVALGGGVLVDGEWTWQLYFHSQPADWIALLKKHDLLRKSLPANNEASRRMMPFEALEAARSRELAPLEQQGLDISLAYGWKTIFSVPFYGPLGYRAALHMAAKTAVDLSPRIRAALWTMAQHMHERCLIESPYAPITLKDPGLTWRELECLQLMTAGLTDKEIARRLGLRPQTVNDHVTRGCKKLKVNSRVGAAAMLALMGKNAMPPDLCQSRPVAPEV